MSRCEDLLLTFLLCVIKPLFCVVAKSSVKGNETAQNDAARRADENFLVQHHPSRHSQTENFDEELRKPKGAKERDDKGAQDDAKGSRKSGIVVLLRRHRIQNRVRTRIDIHQFHKESENHQQRGENGHLKRSHRRRSHQRNRRASQRQPKVHRHILRRARARSRRICTRPGPRSTATSTGPCGRPMSRSTTRSAAR